MSANRPVRVLIIDDEADLVETLAMRLKAVGSFIVETALNGRAGLDKMKPFRPDVVLVDLVMPEADGWEVARRMRADPQTLNIPVVMMTAHVGPDLEDRAEAEGIHRVLFKPFEPAKLLDALTRALPRQRPA